MNTLDVMQGSSSRNERLRLLMLLIIAGTVPFYCFALYIIGSAPAQLDRQSSLPTATPTLAYTFTPLGANLYATATATSPPLYPTYTPLRLAPGSTPLDIVPPTALPAPTDPPSPSPRPRVVVADRDYDGVLDARDQCPDEGGVVDAQGCPFADDADRDGLRGADDACPSEYAPNTPRGCQDFDDDGLDTADDECPQQFGSRANRGCPES